MLNYFIIQTVYVCPAEKCCEFPTPFEIRTKIWTRIGQHLNSKKCPVFELCPVQMVRPFDYRALNCTDFECVRVSGVRYLDPKCSYFYIITVMFYCGSFHTWRFLHIIIVCIIVGIVQCLGIETGARKRV